MIMSENLGKMIYEIILGTTKTNQQHQTVIIQ